MRRRDEAVKTATGPKHPNRGGGTAAAWMGVGYAFNAEDVTLDGKTLEVSPWTFFPAIHLGKAF